MLTRVYVNRSAVQELNETRGQFLRTKCRSANCASEIRRLPMRTIQGRTHHFQVPPARLSSLSKKTGRQAPSEIGLRSPSILLAVLARPLSSAPCPRKACIRPRTQQSVITPRAVEYKMAMVGPGRANRQAAPRVDIAIKQLGSRGPGHIPTRLAVLFHLPKGSKGNRAIRDANLVRRNIGESWRPGRSRFCSGLLQSGIR